MANPYAYTGPGTRWAEEDPTAEDYLNVSRINADYLHDVLSELFTDLDAPETSFVLPSYVSTVLAPTTLVDWVDYTSTANDAYKVIFVDLDNIRFVWDQMEADKLIRKTSWYVELGAPPVHGLFILDASKNAIHWIDRDSATLAVYMTFTGGASNMLRVDGSGSNAVELFFLDFKLWVACDSGYALQLIDFLADTGYLYAAAGVYLFGEDISNRNSGTQSIALYNASPAIVNNTVNGVSAVRDPNGGTDSYGRPLHYWAAATLTGISAFVPDGANGNIYNSSDNSNMFSVYFSPSGVLTNTESGGTDIAIYKVVDTITAGGWAYPTNWGEGGSGGVELPGSGLVLNGSEFLDGAGPIGSGIIVIYGTGGLYLGFYDPVTDTNGGLIHITSTYATPYMKGARVAAYPLDSATDRSGNGHTLANNNAVTFAAGGPTGNYANFVAASSMSLSVADHADFGGMAELTVSCWVYRDIDSGGVEGIITKYDYNDAADRSFQIFVTSSDTIQLTTYTSSEVACAGAAIAVGDWQHIVCTYDGANQKVYQNGILTATAAQTGAIKDTTEKVSIGSRSGSGTSAQFFDGKIAGVFIGKKAFSATEAQAEYRRGQHVLGGATVLLTATDVDSVRIDPDSGYAIVTAGDVAHIIDSATGLVIDTDDDTTATLNDADIISMPGAATPHYVMGRSGKIETVSPSTLVKV